MMECNDVRAWLSQDLDGAADPSADVAAHLERCRDCRAEAARMRSWAEAARAALPAAQVPPGFTDRVMSDLRPTPAPDAVLADATRSRWRRWWPVAAALVVVPFALWAWTATPRAETLELAEGAEMQLGGVTLTALGPCRVETGRTAKLVSGRALLTAVESAVVRTELGEIRLRAGSTLVAALEMKETNMNRAIPAALSVALLTGGATVANAQGEAEPDEIRGVLVERGVAPRNDIDTLRRELAAALRALDRAADRIEAINGRVLALERVRRDARPPAPFAESSRRASDPRRSDAVRRVAGIESEIVKLEKRTKEIHSHRDKLASKLTAVRGKSGEKSELLARSLLEALQKAEDQAAVAAKQRDYLLHALEAERRRAPGARGFGPKKLKGKPAQSFARVYGELLERSRRDLAAAENAADVAAVRAATLKAQQADLAVEIKALKAQAKKLGLPAKADPRYQELAVALNDVNQELARVAAGAFRSDAVTKFKQATATATATATKTSHDVEVQKLKEQVARLMAENRDLRRRIEGGERASTGTFFKHRNAAEFARSKAAFANLLRDIERASGAKRRDALKRLYAVARADSQREAAARLAELHERIMKLGDHVETLAVEKKIEAMRDAADALLKARRQFEQTLEKTMAAQGTPHRRDPK